MTDQTPITLTERERALLSHIARTLGKGEAADDIIVSNALLHFLDEDFRARHTEPSASPPRVPVSSAQPTEVEAESGPGQPMTDWWETLPYSRDSGASAWAVRARDEIRRLRAQVKTERRAGIAEAVKWHDQQAAEWDAVEVRQGPLAREYAKQHRSDAAAIRALADKPAPDARKGG